MVFDVAIEHNGRVYECGIMERSANEQTYFSVDVRIPAYGDTLNIQVHDLELHLDPYSGKFVFRHYPDDMPADVLALEDKLHEAILSIGK